MNTQVDSIFLTTTIIKRFNSDSDMGQATGFFFSNSSGIYLITNKHVIYGDNFGSENAIQIIDKIQIILHTDINDLTKNEKYELLLSKGKWLEHHQRNVDLVAIPISIDRNRYIFATVADDIINSGNIKIGFEKIFIMGYPFGWYDEKHNLPIARIGHLSSPYMVPFQGNPYMLGDVETHKGMSGSPVFMYLKDYITVEGNSQTMNLGSFRILLLGVYSGQPDWKYKDTITNDEKHIPHSLSVIWFSSLITDILSNSKNNV